MTYAEVGLTNDNDQARVHEAVMKDILGDDIIEPCNWTKLIDAIFVNIDP